MDKLIGDSIKSTAMAVTGGALSKLAYEIQENVYNRPNELANISDMLHSPDYLTSFIYPLTLMYSMRSFFSLAELMNREMGNMKVVEPVTRFAVKMIPIVVMGLNLWHELSSKSDYVDHPALDLLAGCAAGLTYIMTTDTKDDLKLAVNKIKSVINPPFDETAAVI